MAVQLFNTLTRKKEVVKPLKDKVIRMYSCGPTVYDFAHIGNFRAYVAVDVLKRYLKYRGFDVMHVMNLTDVDDKTIKGSMKEGISLTKYTDRYAKAFFEDLETLNIDPADEYPRATETIPEMVALINQLVEKDIAYKTDDGIYFNIQKFKDYGKLSHTKLENLEVNKRVKNDEYDKDQLQDFALWKFWDKDDGDVFWEEGIEKGRPGWHLECSAMSMKFLGETFDIHAGGIDLVFPHHENEIAQSEGATGKEFSRLWFHNEHLQVNGKKMSKSLGNFFTLRDLLEKGHDPKAIRYLLLSQHYRVQLNFTEEGIGAAQNAVARLRDFHLNVKEVAEKGNDSNNEEAVELIESVKSNFDKEMDDDLNIANALAHVFEFVTKINSLINENKLSKTDAQKILDVLNGFDSVLGVLGEGEEEVPEEILKLVEEREQAREAKDFAKADEIRDKIKAAGYVVEDRGGSRIKKF